MSSELSDVAKMRGVLFAVFVGQFILIFFAALTSLYFGFGHFTESQRTVLFSSLIMEIVAAVIGLFYALFGLRNAGNQVPRKIRLIFERIRDVKQFVLRQAICSPRLTNGEVVEDVKCTVLDDKGPYLSLQVPPNTVYILIRVDIRGKTYTGSLAVDSHLVPCKKMWTDMSIELDNTSKYEGKDGSTHWWAFTVFINCKAPDRLEDVDYVEYELHPTFVNPVRIVRHRQGGFRLSGEAWGTFQVRARILFKSHRDPLRLNHTLRFEHEELEYENVQSH